MAEDSLDDDDMDGARSMINMKQLSIGEQLGDRVFYVYHKAELRNGNRTLPVVVKGPANPDDKTQRRMVLDEIELLTKIPKHPNILAFVGVAQHDEDPASSILEFAEKGGLRNFLKNAEAQGKFINQMVEDDEDGFEMVHLGNNQNDNNERSVKRNDPDAVYVSDLVAFGYGVANGMKKLAGLSYVHRQLDLRRVYITSDRTVRIGHLGLAREAGSKYYKILHPEMPLPFHTTAPEALTSRKFTEASDVWSFGICLYELFTLASVPLYPDGGDIVGYLEEGNRLPKPDYCPEEIYDFMLKCWDGEPEKRPKFEECVRFLEDYLRQHAPQVLRKVHENLQAATEFQRTLENWVR